MPGTRDSKLEAIGPVSVEMAPVLIWVAVTPGALDVVVAADAPVAVSPTVMAAASTLLGRGGDPTPHLCALTCPYPTPFVAVILPRRGGRVRRHRPDPPGRADP